VKIGISDIEKVARLARLELSPEEKQEFSGQLSKIIDYVEKIKELDTSNVKPAEHIVPLNNVFRKDEVKDSIDRDAIESIAPIFKNGHIVVPKIIE